MVVYVGAVERGCAVDWHCGVLNSLLDVGVLSYCVVVDYPCDANVVVAGTVLGLGGLTWLGWNYR